MPVIYLGLFQRILDWILDKIFTPVFKFIADLLGKVLTWIFENILAPLLTVVFETVFPVLLDILVKALAKVLYGLLVMVLKLVDCIQIAFDVLIGMTPVQYTLAGGAVVNDALLPVLFQQPAIRTVFLQITLLGLGIAGLLAIYAVVRSTFDFEMENRRPVGQVLQSCFKTALNFLLVPLFAYVMISLSGVILEAMNEALDTETHTLGSTIFLVSSLEAAKQSSYNTNPSLTDTLRLPYANGTKDYTDVDVVEADFALEKVDYIVGFGAAVFLLVILGVCLILFVQRIYEVIVLYICSPLFVSVMPLDEGEKFSKWREMFVAKIFTGFGAAIGMRIYLMILPLIMNGSIDFTAGGSASSSMNYVIKLVFVLGGAWAVFKSSSLITSLLSFQAAQSESMTAAVVGGAVFANTAGRAGSMAYRGASRMVQRSPSKDNKNAEAKQAFSDKKHAMAGGQGGVPGLSKDQKASAAQKKSPGGGSGAPGAASARHRHAPADTSGQRVFEHGRLGLNRNARGKLQLGAWSGSRLGVGRREDGSLGVNRLKVAGLTFKRGEDGKLGLKKVSVPGLTFKRQADGRMAMTHLGSKGGGVDFAYTGDDKQSKLGAMRFGSSNVTFAAGRTAMGGSQTTSDSGSGSADSSSSPPPHPTPQTTSDPGSGGSGSIPPPPHPASHPTSDPGSGGSDSIPPPPPRPAPRPTSDSGPGVSGSIPPPQRPVSHPTSDSGSDGSGSISPPPQRPAPRPPSDSDPGGSPGGKKPS